MGDLDSDCSDDYFDRYVDDNELKEEIRIVMYGMRL